MTLQAVLEGSRADCEGGWSEGSGDSGHRGRKYVSDCWTEENIGSSHKIQFMEFSRSTPLEGGLGLGRTLSSLLFLLCGHGC